LSRFSNKTIVVPRQAQDKHRESTQKRDRFSSGCDLEDQPVATIGQILLSELGLWGGTDSASSGVATMAEALLRSQKDGKLGPIKMRLVQCTLDTRAQAAYDKLDKVPPPPLPDSAPGEQPSDKTINCLLSR